MTEGIVVEFIRRALGVVNSFSLVLDLLPLVYIVNESLDVIFQNKERYIQSFGVNGVGFNAVDNVGQILLG